MAGIDGVLNKYTLDGTAFGPYDDNIFEWPESKRNKLLSLPTNLNEAIEAIEKGHAFLLKGNVFDSKLIEDLIELKRQEIKSAETRPHPQEMVLYFNL